MQISRVSFLFPLQDFILKSSATCSFVPAFCFFLQKERVKILFLKSDFLDFRTVIFYRFCLSFLLLVFSLF